MATITMVYEVDKLTTDSQGRDLQIINNPLVIQELDGSAGAGAGTVSATLNSKTRYIAVQPTSTNGYFGFVTTTGALIAGVRYASVQGVPFFVRVPPGATKVTVQDR